jgi:cytochrome c oxidase assembly factor CtaG
VTPLLAHVGGGTLEPLQVAGLTVVATAYAFRARTLALAGRPVPVWRLLCFASGLALIAGAFVSPLAHLGGELLLAHMAQHLVIGDIGALLLVLGLTGPMLQPLLAIRWLGWLRTLTHPLIAFPLWFANLYIWHIPALYEAAQGGAAVHALEHACFIGFGVLMWMPLVGPLPKPAWFGIPAKIGYVVGVRLAGTVLGNVFMWSNDVLYPRYESGDRFWNVSPLSDQGIAGVIMVGEGGLVTLGVLVWLFLTWAQQDTERQRLLDLAESQGVPLSPARAARAAAAGEGARLEERIKGST